MKANKSMVDDWKKYYLSLGHSYPSMRTYYSFISRYVGEEIEVNQRTINKFRESNMSSPACGSLKNFIAYLIRRKGFPVELLGLHFDKSISKRRLPKSISKGEVDLIIQKMGEHSLKVKVFTIISYELALRIREVLKLKWENFNWNEWILDKKSWGKVNLLETKRNKFAVLPVKPELMNMLYNGHPNKTSSGVPIGNLVFDFGIIDYMNNKEKSEDQNREDYLINAGQEYRRLLYSISKDVLGKRISPHTFRHSKAQHLVDKGMALESVQMLLRHADISTTGIYAVASSERIKSDMEKYG